MLREVDKLDQEDPVYVVLHKYTKALTSALGYRDTLTRLHSERVLGLATQIGLGRGLRGAELGLLKISAAFHDIGKIGIPDRILLKTSPLDEAEWVMMKQHSEMGQRILAATEIEGAQAASLVIRHHHEHYNGGGYPDRLVGAQISIFSRIISIADSYDAMAATRSYHRAKTHTEIMAILQAETGARHDPELMRIFCAIIGSSEFRTASN